MRDPVVSCLIDLCSYLTPSPKVYIPCLALYCILMCDAMVIFMLCNKILAELEGTMDLVDVVEAARDEERHKRHVKLSLRCASKVVIYHPV